MAYKPKNELKTCDRLEAGTLLIDWEKRTIMIKGCAGFPEGNVKPHIVWEWLMQAKAAPDPNVTKVAIVASDTSDGLLQIACYDLEEFEKEVYGPIAKKEGAT